MVISLHNLLLKCWLLCSLASIHSEFTSIQIFSCYTSNLFYICVFCVSLVLSDVRGVVVFKISHCFESFRWFCTFNWKVIVVFRYSFCTWHELNTVKVYLNFFFFGVLRNHCLKHFKYMKGHYHSKRLSASDLLNQIFLYLSHLLSVICLI